MFLVVLVIFVDPASDHVDDLNAPIRGHLSQLPGDFGAPYVYGKGSDRLFFDDIFHAPCSFIWAPFFFCSVGKSPTHFGIMVRVVPDEILQRNAKPSGTA